ncbi:MAG: hypothetical protein N3A63_09310 [Bacteroidetes bacterium]|nr:hypothetical protein [Bacteroidota bacterium]
MLDIVLSVFIGGTIILLILNANFIMQDISAYYTSEVIVQRMLLANAQILEVELRNMGCGVPAGQQSVIFASDTCIQFFTAPRPESPNLDRIKFYCGSVHELAYTDNPYDRFLYRQKNNEPPQRIGLVTDFLLKYYGTNGNRMVTPVPTSQLVNIRLVEINLAVQNPFSLMAVEDTSQMADWQLKSRWAYGVWRQTRVASPNLIR